MVQSLCFGTLAVGDRARLHASLLADDIQRYAPGISLLVLTDQPNDFLEYDHVLALPHRLRHVNRGHDKRFVLEQALLRYETCIVLDADVRLVGQVDLTMDWQPGITARFGDSLMMLKPGGDQRLRLSPLLPQIKHCLDVDLEQVQWVDEFCFAMRRCRGKEATFFQLWDNLALYLERHDVYDNTGIVIGLAAYLAHLPVEVLRYDWLPFFKECIETARIAQGEATPTDRATCFMLHRAIATPPQTLWQKGWQRMSRKATLAYHRLLVRQQVPDPTQLLMTVRALSRPASRSLAQPSV